MTWLEMVQDILNDMDSDPVNSYDDTEESRQVSQILELTYFKIIDSRQWPFLFNTFNLTETNASTPMVMSLPDNYRAIKWIKYNKTASGSKNEYRLVSYLTPEHFFDITDARDTGDANVDSVTYNSTNFNIINDTGPTYYTSFDETNLIFDSYDSGVDSYLQGSKTRGYGMSYPSITISDALDVTLPTDMFSYLVQEAKAMCFLVLKQAQNPRAELDALIQERRQLLDGWKFRDNGNFVDPRGQIVTPQNRQQGQ